MKKILIHTATLLVFLVGCNSNPEESKIDLSGQWQFRMDPNDVGESEMWFNENLTETVQLPGSMDTNGKGEPITMETNWTGGIQDPEWTVRPHYAPFHDPQNVRIPFWLQPDQKY
jgi:beta-galactosidase/beta-glucuronidase